MFVVIPGQKVFEGTRIFLLLDTGQILIVFCPVAGGCFNFSYDNASLDVMPPSLNPLKCQKFFPGDYCCTVC